MLYEISDRVKNNILAFLDRVRYQGLQENAALNEILKVLNSPIQESVEKDN